MKLREFLEDWAKDGANTIEHERREKDGTTWILYKVTEPEGTSEYGRHYALFVCIDAAEEIVAHNFHNTTGQRSDKSWYEQTQEWWEEHTEEGLVDPEGRRVCV